MARPLPPYSSDCENMWSQKRIPLALLLRSGALSEHQKVLTRAWWRTLTAHPNTVSSAPCPTRPTSQSTSSVRWALPWTQATAVRCGRTGTHKTPACLHRPAWPPKKRWTDSFGSFPSTVFYLCAKVIWGVGPNARGWGEHLPTLIFFSVRINRYQIFLCRHISPHGLALFICSLNSRDAYMCVSVLHTLIACLLIWKIWPLWSHWECLSVTSQEMFGSICDDFTGRFTEDSQEVLNDIRDPPQEGRKPISQLWFHRNAIKWQGELLFVHPTCVSCFDLDKVEMKCSF